MIVVSTIILPLSCSVASLSSYVTIFEMTSSYDRARETLIFRHFHIEGFVNHYILNELADDSQTFRFITEGIENIPPGWLARETYRVLSPNEFVEVFELAAPGKDFEVYSENRFQRVRSE